MVELTLLVGDARPAVVAGAVVTAASPALPRCRRWLAPACVTGLAASGALHLSLTSGPNYGDPLLGGQDPLVHLDLPVDDVRDAHTLLVPVEDPARQRPVGLPTTATAATCSPAVLPLRQEPRR